eukprot:2659329-Rhodomonas_salina.1
MGKRGEPYGVPRAAWSMKKRGEKKRREESDSDVRSQEIRCSRRGRMRLHVELAHKEGSEVFAVGARSAAHSRERRTTKTDGRSEDLRKGTRPETLMQSTRREGRLAQSSNRKGGCGPGAVCPGKCGKTTCWDAARHPHTFL